MPCDTFKSSMISRRFGVGSFISSSRTGFFARLFAAGDPKLDRGDVTSDPLDVAPTVVVRVESPLASCSARCGGASLPDSRRTARLDASVGRRGLPLEAIRVHRLRPPLVGVSCRRCFWHLQSKNQNVGLLNVERSDLDTSHSRRS